MTIRDSWRRAYSDTMVSASPSLEKTTSQPHWASKRSRMRRYPLRDRLRLDGLAQREHLLAQDLRDLARLIRHDAHLLFGACVVPLVEALGGYIGMQRQALTIWDTVSWISLLRRLRSRSICNSRSFFDIWMRWIKAPSARPSSSKKPWSPSLQGNARL